jgi:hypothetical protein
MPKTDELAYDDFLFRSTWLRLLAAIFFGGLASTKTASLGRRHPCSSRT